MNVSSRTSKGVGLGVEDPVIQADDIGLGEEEVEVLEGLGDPETLHLVFEIGRLGEDVPDGAVCEFGACSADDGFEHLPSLVHPGWVASDAVHVPNGFDGFGTV